MVFPATLSPQSTTIYHAFHHVLRTQNRKTPSKNAPSPRRKKSKTNSASEASRSPDAHKPAESPPVPAASGPEIQSESKTAHTPPPAHPAPPPEPPPAYSTPPAPHRTSQ